MTAHAGSIHRIWMIRGYLDLFARMLGEENRVILTSGNEVIYPSKGPCLIGPVVNKLNERRSLSIGSAIENCGKHWKATLRARRALNPETTETGFSMVEPID
jgi:hypothetical protein